MCTLFGTEAIHQLYLGQLFLFSSIDNIYTLYVQARAMNKNNNTTPFFNDYNRASPGW